MKKSIFIIASFALGAIGLFAAYPSLAVVPKTYPNEISIKNGSGTPLIFEIQRAGSRYAMKKLAEKGEPSSLTVNLAPGEILEKYNKWQQYIGVAVYRSLSEDPFDGESLENKKGSVYLMYSDTGLKEVTPQEWETQAKSATKKVGHEAVGRV